MRLTGAVATAGAALSSPAAGAAVVTPQAAGASGQLAPQAQRRRALTQIAFGGSSALVQGLPRGAWPAQTLGWRWAFNGGVLRRAGPGIQRRVGHG